MKLKLTTLLFSLSLLVVTGCREFYDFFDDLQPEKTKVIEYASGLATPIGLAIDNKDRLWITEIGTGNTDGKVSVIGPNGTKYVVIEGFPSVSGPEGTVGLNHLIEKDGMLYILHTNGLLYKANISSFRLGDAPLKANALMTENIGSFVLNYDFEEDAEESNPYNLTVGPAGDLYIADAAANAIIRRTQSGELSVFATLPNIANPLPLGPPSIHAVPTSITLSQKKFYVTTLTGFPFPTGKARIFSLDLFGNVTGYQEGFTTLTDLALDGTNNPVVAEHAQFTEQGFAPNSGRVVVASGNNQAILVPGLNFPTSIVRNAAGAYYVNSLADGKIFKVTTK